jgi:hypothetical protein
VVRSVDPHPFFRGNLASHHVRHDLRAKGAEKNGKERHRGASGAKLGEVAIPRRQRRAVGQAINALKAGGLLEKTDEGVCALARASAELLDETLAYGEVKLYALSNMMRTHLMIVEALRSRAAEAPADQGLMDVIAALSTPPGYADADEDPAYWRTHGTHPERGDGG